jgi:hypothetical protein
MISKYNEFLIKESFRLILEANLELMPNLEMILKSMESPIAKFILDLKGVDLNTDINILDQDLKEPGYITYIPQKKIDDNLFFVEWKGELYSGWSDGEKYFNIPIGTSMDNVKIGTIGKVVKIAKYFEILRGEDSGEEVAHFVSTTGENYIIGLRGLQKINYNPSHQQSGKSGRVIIKILNLVEQNFTPQDIENFSNEYKSKTTNQSFELVSGDDIKYWYLGERYVTSEGTLGNSCMRYPRCQSYFGIYVDNPEVCKLLILKSPDNQELIIGRALVWTLTDGRIFMDRIYYTSDYIKDTFIGYAKKNGWLHKEEQNSSDSTNIIDTKIKAGHGEIYTDTLVVELKYNKDHYSKFPYMDTLKYWDGYRNDKICNDPSSYDYGMEDTEGGDGGCSGCGGTGTIVCDNCDETGRVECGDCDGDGRVDCSECDGRGKIDCDECSGGKVDCDECNGSGEIDGENCEKCEGGGEMDCEDCSGKSYITCPDCDGDRDQECNLCGGDGDLECEECYGRGQIDCPDCS